MCFTIFRFNFQRFVANRPHFVDLFSGGIRNVNNAHHWECRERETSAGAELCWMNARAKRTACSSVFCTYSVAVSVRIWCTVTYFSPNMAHKTEQTNEASVPCFSFIFLWLTLKWFRRECVCVSTKRSDMIHINTTYDVHCVLSNGVIHLQA